MVNQHGTAGAGMNGETSPPGTGVQDAFLRLLEGTDIGERTLFHSVSPFGSSPGLDRQFQGLFTPAFNSFLGALGQQIRTGGEPTLTFNQFLTEQFDPRRALLQLPGQRRDVAAGGTVFNLW